MIVGLDKFAGVDIRVRVTGGGHTSQIYAIRQAIAKSLVAYYQKYVDEYAKNQLKAAFVAYDRTLLVADPRRTEPKVHITGEGRGRGTEILTFLSEIRWSRCSRPLPEVLPLNRYGSGGYGIPCYVGAWRLHYHMVLACCGAGCRTLGSKNATILQTIYPPSMERLENNLLYVLCYGYVQIVQISQKEIGRKKCDTRQCDPNTRERQKREEKEVTCAPCSRSNEAHLRSPFDLLKIHSGSICVSEMRGCDCELALWSLTNTLYLFSIFIPMF